MKQQKTNNLDKRTLTTLNFLKGQLESHQTKFGGSEFDHVTEEIRLKLIQIIEGSIPMFDSSVLFEETNLLLNYKDICYLYLIYVNGTFRFVIRCKESTLETSCEADYSSSRYFDTMLKLFSLYEDYNTRNSISNTEICPKDDKLHYLYLEIATETTILEEYFDM